jgi:hypothetical protein
MTIGPARSLKLATLALLAASTACSLDDRPAWLGGKAHGTGSAAGDLGLGRAAVADEPLAPTEPVLAATVSTETLAATDDRLVEAAADGPQSQFLDSVALNSKYKAIFGADNPRNETSYRWSLMQPDVFFADERAKLGTFNRRSTDVAEQNAAWMAGLTQDYIGVVRKFLAGSCTKLAKAEYDDGVASDNKLVKSTLVAAPGAAAVDGVMSMFFGYALPGGALHDGAAEYDRIFATNAAEWTAANPSAYASLRRDFVVKQYVLLCMSVGQDLRALMR